MSAKTYMTPAEVEQAMQARRNVEGFTGKTEEISVKNMVATARKNGSIGDKVIMIANPIHIHIPSWQRDLRVKNAYQIANSYNPKMYDPVKVMYVNGKLLCVDGMHRVYGTFLAGKEDIVIELITGISEKEAAKLFLNQSVNRNKMSLADNYNAAVKAEVDNYVKLKQICSKHMVRVKSDRTMKNYVGTLTTIRDALDIIKSDPNKLDLIFTTIINMEWHESTKGNPFGSKAIRSFKRIIGAHNETETARIISIIRDNFSGADVFEELDKNYFETFYNVINSKVNMELNNEVITLRNIM